MKTTTILSLGLAMLLTLPLVIPMLAELFGLADQLDLIAGGQHVGGSDDIHALDHEGKLDALLFQLFRDGPCVGDRAREAVKLRHDKHVACAHGGEGPCPILGAFSIPPKTNPLNNQTRARRV